MPNEKDSTARLIRECEDAGVDVEDLLREALAEELDGMDDEPRGRWRVTGYKPSSTDYCRGCLMESYNSDYSEESGLSQQDAVEEVARLLVANEDMRVNEDGWQISVWRDARQIVDEGCEIWESFYRIVERAKALAARETKEAADLALAKATEKAAQEEREAAERKEKRDRAAYLRLKAKYGVDEDSTPPPGAAAAPPPP